MARGRAGVFLESYNSTKHNPRVNLTSPGGASWTPKREKKRTVEKEEAPGGNEGGEGRKGGWVSIFECRSGKNRRRCREWERDNGGSSPRMMRRAGGEGKRKRERDGKSSRIRFGASPIILQSSATTHRHFLPPRNGEDAQIALMVDQRENPRSSPTGTYLFPSFVCLPVSPPSKRDADVCCPRLGAAR